MDRIQGPHDPNINANLGAGLPGLPPLDQGMFDMVNLGGQPVMGRSPQEQLLSGQSPVQQIEIPQGQQEPIKGRVPTLECEKEMADLAAAVIALKDGNTDKKNVEELLSKFEKKLSEYENSINTNKDLRKNEISILTGKKSFLASFKNQAVIMKEELNRKPINFDLLNSCIYQFANLNALSNTMAQGINESPVEDSSINDAEHRLAKGALDADIAARSQEQIAATAISNKMKQLYMIQNQYQEKFLEMNITEQLKQQYNQTQAQIQANWMKFNSEIAKLQQDTLTTIQKNYEEVTVSKTKSQLDILKKWSQLIMS